MKTLLSFTIFASLILGQFNAPLASTPAEISTETATLTVEPTVSPTETAVPITETLPVITETPVVTPTASATETPATAVTEIASSPTLDTPLLFLVADPDYLTANSKLSLNWTIEGVILEEHKALVLQITLPEELSLQEGYEGKFDETTRTLTISITALSGQVNLLTGPSVNETKLSALLMDGSEMLAETGIFLPIQEQFVVDEKGGEITANEGKIKIEFPQDVFSEKTVIEVGPPSGDSVPAYSLLGQPFEITAYEEQSKTELKQFSKELKFAISYADLELPETLEGDLYLYWYNTETKEWEGLPSRVDKETKTLIAYTDHFTVFDMDVNNWQSSHLPTVDSFQVSSFTGAGTYSLPIEVPPGPGGFQPSVSLNYNSQVVDQSTLKTQASWVGMGWSLDTGSIEIDSHGTSDWTYDDTHLLNVAGVSTRIVKDPSGVYHAADENFWKITYSAGTWNVKDKQGNTYTFGKAVNYPFEEDSCNDDWTTHRWMLTKVTNIFGQEINYTYADQTKQIQFWENCIWNWATATTATYPSTITYANGKYGIFFDRGTNPNRQDYSSAWDTDLLYHAFEKYRLANIYVKQDSNGNGIIELADTTIRRYELGYAANGASDIIFPGYQWTAGGKTNTLKSVKQYGVGGATSLPPTNFIYGDNLHLTRAENGYGGAVEFDYDPDQDTDLDPWYYAADARPSYSVEIIFGDYGHMPCFDGVESPWVARTGFFGCDARDPLYMWGPLTVVTAGDMKNHVNSYYRNHSKDLVRPGGVYKLTPSISADAGVSLRVGLNDGTRDHWRNTGSPYFITLPADATKVEPLIEETGGSLGWPPQKSARVWSFKLQLLTSIYRVTKKTVFYGTGQSYDFSYDYTLSSADTAGVNDTVNSSTTCSPYVTNVDLADHTCHAYFERYSEFRGHKRVTETGPDGKVTITEFHQSDLLKGRPMWTEIKNGSTRVSSVFHNYTSASLPTATVLACGPCSPYLGLTRTFVYTDSVENRIYDSNGTTYHATQTIYDYETTYGNLIQQTEGELNGSTFTPYRTTITTYKPFTSADKYLVGLPARQLVRQGNETGATQSEVLYLYDGNTGSWNTQPSVGKLTGMRTWVDGPIPTGNYSEVSYGYDNYGNRTKQTTYTAYTDADGPTPSSGAQNSYTCYGSGETLDGTACTDDYYRAYPLWTKNHLDQKTSWTYDYTLGVPVTESDANDSGGNDTTVSAVYDVFGRMTKLIRPGDDSTSPTVSIKYSDTDPFWTEIRQRIDTNRYIAIRRTYDGIGRQTKIEKASSLLNVVNGTFSFTLDNTVSFQYPAFNIVEQSMPYGIGETPVYTTTFSDVLGRPQTVTAPDGNSTSYLYNGLVTTVTDARGNNTISISDLWGQVASVTPATGPSVSYTYDIMGRLLTATREYIPAPVGTNPGTANLVSWWGLNETSGTRNDSYAPGANHLADNNAVTSGIGKVGNAANFASANTQYLSVNDNPGLSMNGTSFTIAGWVKFTTAGAENQVVVGKQGSGSLNEYQIYKNTSNKLVFAVYGNTSGSISGVATTTASVSPGTWYFFTAQYDGSNVKISLNAGTFNSTAYTNGAVDNTNSFRLGANTGGAYLNGSLDEVVVYKRALTANEINWLYNNGSGRTYADLTPTPDPNATTTTIAYDKAGRKISMSDPDMGNWTYSYDALGNLTLQKDARGQRICLYYDSLNRLTGKHYRTDDNCPTTQPANAEAAYVYDNGTNGMGRRTSMTSLSNGETVSNSWTYDTRGRMKTETAMGYTTEWDYNAADLPIWMEYPDGEVVNYNYDSRMLLNSVIGTNTYVSSTTYDSAGRMDLRTLGNNLTQNYDYYAWNEKATVDSQLIGQGGRLKNMTVGTLQNLNYIYDAVGNIQQITNPIASETNIYDYDSLNRLISWDLNGTAETYTYETATGNLDVKAGMDLNYNDAAHKHAVTHIGSTQKYWYDANGSQTTRVMGSDTFNLIYDAENRLVEVKKNSSVIATFVYDGDGKRVKSVIGSETILFVGGHHEIKNPGSGQEVTKYYFAGASIIAMRKYTIPQSTTLNYLLGDHLGSTSLTTDDTGNLLVETRYKAWGEVRYTTLDQTLPTRYTYTGQYSYINDEATDLGSAGFGLMFYNARWYDPYITQFSQPDSIIPDPYNSQDWNRYSYVRNNPLRYTDPTGHCIDGITTWACIAVVGAIVLKGIDYGWTGYDMYQSGRTLSSSSASRTEKMFAGLNVALAVVFEAGEPDDLLPAGLPLDDAGRKLVMKGAKDAFEEGGEAGLEKFLRDKLGNYADEALNKIGLNNFRSPELLAQHFEKHASEFGYKTIDEYISGARSLVNSSDGILTFTRTNGDQLFYNPVTNEFAALTSDGVIKTFFKPKDGMKYWLKLIGK